MRFAAMRDPCDDWLVYDLVFDPPAEMYGRPLIGLTRNQAAHLVDRVETETSGKRVNSLVSFAVGA